MANMQAVIIILTGVPITTSGVLNLGAILVKKYLKVALFDVGEPSNRSRNRDN